MAYCPTCFAEYRDEITRCAECDVALVPMSELSKLPEFKRTKGVDTARFVRVTVAEDPFDSESFCDALEAAGIPVMARARRASAMDGFTSPLTRDWWEILVPDAYLARAESVVDKRREELRASEEEAAQSADEDELEGEKSGT